MTLNILFFTMTIKKRNITLEEAIRDQQAMDAYEQAKTRVLDAQRLF
ncbi:YrzI family small protein [Robertmurraya sp. FSL W8-0741]